MPQAPAHPLRAHRIGSVALFCALFLIRGRRLTAGRRCVPWALDNYGFFRPVENAMLLLGIPGRELDASGGHDHFGPSLGVGGRVTHMPGGRGWMLGVSVCMPALSVNPYVSITV